MAQAESTWVRGSVPEWFTRSETVTHPGTNRARCRVTTLIESNALPLCHASTSEKTSGKILHVPMGTCKPLNGRNLNPWANASPEMPPSRKLPPGENLKTDTNPTLLLTLTDPEGRDLKLTDSGIFIKSDTNPICWPYPTRRRGNISRVISPWGVYLWGGKVRR